MSTEIRGHSFDANQNETMEKSTLEWDEQLEKEIFSGKCVSLFWYCLIVLLPEVIVAERIFCRSTGRKTWLISSRVATFCCLCLTAECLLQH